MARAVEELIGDDELQRLVLFLERSDGGNGDDALDAELLESVDIGAEVEFGWKNSVAASVACEEGDLAAFEHAANVGVGRSAERSFHLYFLDFRQARHRVEAAAADNSDFRLCQSTSRNTSECVSQTRDYTRRRWRDS